MPKDRLVYRPKNIADVFIDKMKNTREIFIHSGPLIKDLIRGFLGTASRWVKPEELEQSILKYGDVNTQNVLIELKRISAQIKPVRHRDLFYKTMLFGLWYSCFDPAYSDPMWNLVLALQDRKIKVVRNQIETDSEKWWINLNPK